MRPSRLFLPLFFALALLFAQQGSTAHAFSHVFAEQGQDQDKRAAHAQTCEKCASYAQLGSALHTPVHHFAVAVFSAEQAAPPLSTFRSHRSFAAFARGPPAPAQKTA